VLQVEELVVAYGSLTAVSGVSFQIGPGEIFGLKSIAGWSPVGALITLFSDVLNQTAWSAQDTYSILACAGCIIVFSIIGIRWFRWETR
jgi:ABC-type phosphonate transport system ATPase subunit